MKIEVELTSDELLVALMQGLCQLGRLPTGTYDGKVYLDARSDGNHTLVVEKKEDTP